MKSPLLATGLIGLAIVGLWYFGGGTQSLPTAQAEESTYVATPLMHENLTVYFVCGPDAMPDAKVLSLQEGLEREVAVVNETSNVNALTVENRSPDSELFIQSGDIVKGGKQDRVAAIDMLLPPASGVVTLPVNCVEHGRWTARGNEDSRQFKSSNNCIAGKNLKYANATFQQPAVWENVRQEQGKLNANVGTSVNAPASPSSFQLSLESPAIKLKIAKYEAALKAAGEDRTDIIGVVFVVNGQVTSAEVYGSNALFRKAWPKLLTASAVEAVAERSDKSAVMPPSADEIELFLARAAEPEPVVANEANQRTAARIRNRIGNLGRAVAVANDEEAFQTEGLMPNVEVLQTEGRAPQTAQQSNLRSSPVNPSVQPAPNPPGAQQGGQPLPAVSYGVASQSNEPDRTGQIIIGGNTVTGDRVILNQVSLPPGQVAPPANANVNQLSSNRTENRSTLVVESRDAKRQNAVIHRSYIKK